MEFSDVEEHGAGEDRERDAWVVQGMKCEPQILGWMVKLGGHRQHRNLESAPWPKIEKTQTK